jgi:hypothetical protein
MVTHHVQARYFMEIEAAGTLMDVAAVKSYLLMWLFMLFCYLHAQLIQDLFKR